MTDPSWLPPLDAQGPAAFMSLAIEIALQSARHGGGPFGAVVADAQGRLVEVGWNQVVASRDSTAHAEIVAIRRAEAKLGTHRLDGCTLYTSCAPCIQCFGAIYWSGLARVVASARQEDAEAIGFEEGPMNDALWSRALAEKGILYEGDVLRDEQALAPFRAYAQAGGRNYSRG